MEDLNSNQEDIEDFSIEDKRFLFIVESHHPFNFRMKFHRHAFYELTFVIGGKGQYEIIRPTGHLEVIEVEQNTILLWDGRVPHRAKDDLGDPLHQIISIFDDAYLIYLPLKKEMIKRLSFSNPLILKNPMYTLSIKPLMRKLLIEKRTRKYLFGSAVFGILMNILTTILRIYSGMDEKINGGSIDSRIRKAVQFIDDNFYNHIYLRDISSYCNLSVRHFCGLFKKQMGMSFVQYLHSCRIEWAKKHLRETDKSITDIAFEAGYDDTAHFIKWFKRLEGITPSLYRKFKAWPDRA